MAAEIISFVDANGHVQDVSPANPLPVTGGGGSQTNYALETGGNLATLATASASQATAANQATGNTSLATLATASASQATAANQATGNTSLATLATASASQATAANQATGNTSLATLATASASQATAANQATGNTSLATLATASASQATAANQATQIANEGTDNTGVSQPSSGSGLRGWLSAIYKQMIAGVSTSALSLSAVLASDQATIPAYVSPPQILAQPASNSLAAANATAAWTLNPGQYLLSLTNGPGATSQFVGTVTFQVSINSGLNWSTINGVPLSGPTAANVNNSTAVGLWLITVPNGAPGSVLVRTNMTAYTSGTVYADVAPVGQLGSTILLPWTYTVTSGQTLVGSIATNGLAEIDISVSAITTTVLTAQGTNDPSLTTWDILAVQTTSSGNPISNGTMTAIGTFRINLGGYKFARVQCTTTGTVLTVQGVSARLGSPPFTTTSQNLQQIGGAPTAASIANGSTNKVLGISQATAVSQIDVSSGAFAGAGSVLGTVIASAQGGGGVVSAEINMSALTLGTATGVLLILQESGGGSNFTDIWISDIFVGTGVQRMPAIPVAGRRRWRAFNVGGTSTTVTVTITALELPTGSYPILRQFRDLYAAATSFQSMTNNVAQIASTMVLSTLNSVSSTANIEGCKNVTAFAVFIGGTPTTAPVITLMFSMDGTNWFTSTNTFTPTAAGVSGVSVSNNAWKYAQLKVTTAMAGGTNYTLGAVGINGVN